MIEFIYVCSDTNTVMHFRWNWSGWLSYATLTFIGLILLPIAWMRYMWNKYVDYFGREVRDPPNRFINYLYRSSEFISNHVEIRILIYIIAFLLFVACVFLEVV